MIAKSLNEYDDYTNVEVADKYVKSVVPECEYMEKIKGYTCCFVPLDKKLVGLEDDENDSGWVYEIQGNLYKTIYTNNYKYLVDNYKSCEQLSLF